MTVVRSTHVVSEAVRAGRSLRDRRDIGKLTRTGADASSSGEPTSARPNRGARARVAAGAAWNLAWRKALPFASYCSDQESPIYINHLQDVCHG